MANWADIAATVAKTAPILGNLLPGVGTIAGAGVGAVAAIVASALGTSADPDSIDAALKADPEALLKLKQAELDNAATLATLAVTREQNQLVAENARLASDAADRANARDREVKTGDKWTPRALAMVVVLGWIGVQFFVLSHVVDASMRELVSRLLGTLDAALMAVLYYYFGSSASSDRKTEIMGTK